MKSPILTIGGAWLLAGFLVFAGAQRSLAQFTFTGDGLWTNTENWDQGILPPDDETTIINGNCEVAENIGAANTINPSRIVIGQGTVGSLRVTGGTLSGAHGGASGIFVGEGAGGDGTLVIEQGAAFRSQGAAMNVRIGDDFGGSGKVTVAGELLTFKFFEIINGTLEMMSSGINGKFNSVDPSLIGANGTLAYVIDGADVGTMSRSNTNGLQVTIDPAAKLDITLGGEFAIDDSWTLMEYTILSGQFSQGTSFTNDQGYTFDVDYGSGSNDALVLTLTSDELRPQLNSFVADPPSAASGATVQLSWDVGNFDFLLIDQGIGNVTPAGGMGSVDVIPVATTTYTLFASLEDVTVEQTVTVVVDELPVIESFTTLEKVIAPGDHATLEWSVSGASSVDISGGVGSVSGQGMRDVTPAVTTTYTLTAINGTGTVSADVTVRVDAIDAALVHQYLAQAPGQTSGALLDTVGASNFDVRNGDLRAVSGSDHTTFTQEMGRMDNFAEDGGDNGDGFPDGRTFELWVRVAELTAAPEVIFDTGTVADGLAVLVGGESIRVIQSTGGLQTTDISVPVALVNSMDFIQITVVLDSDAGTVTLRVLGAAGGTGNAMAAGGGVPDGRASLFSWSGFGGGAAASLGGLGDAQLPDGLTTFQGTVALINVYGRALSEAEVGEAFARWTVDVPAGDSDNDMLPDFWEQLYFGNLDQDADGDGDGDSLSNGEELLVNTNPTEPDSDFDGLSDSEETMGGGGTDPNNPDTDGDLLSDGEEVNGAPSTDPLLADTDGDTFSDSVELSEGSDPNSSASVPDAFIGQAPVDVFQSLGTGASFATTYPGLDLLDATFRLCVDFEAKPDGEREVLFETGGGGTGLSLVYEAGSQLVLRAAGAAVLAEVFYSLSPAQIAAGDLEVVFTFDANDDDAELGGSTVALYVNGAPVGSDNDALGGDWSGANGFSFGIAGTGIAGIEGGGDLAGVDFTSGSINLRKGLQFYSDVLFTGAIAELEITSFSFDGVTATITFNSVAGQDYAVEDSRDLTAWTEIDDPTATGSTTTVMIGYDPAVIPRVYLRVREL